MILVLGDGCFNNLTLLVSTVDSEKIHMTSQRWILGIMWFDHVANITVSEKTGLNGPPLITADRRHSLFGHICQLLPEAPVHQALQLCIDASNGVRLETSTWPTTSNHGDSCKWRRTWGNLWAQLRSQPWISQCRGRYDPQLVMRSSEWVSRFSTGTSALQLTLVVEVMVIWNYNLSILSVLFLLHGVSVC